MELTELTAVEMRKMSAAEMKEAEDSVREDIAALRLRAPLSKEGINVSRQRKLRRVLARLLTIRTERQLQTPAVAAAGIAASAVGENTAAPEVLAEQEVQHGE